MRKDTIKPEAMEQALRLFSERGIQIEGFSHTPTDYAKGTVLEPDHVSTLKASFGEYEELGKKRDDLTKKIDSLNEAMKMSRQRGAFQALQNQMKAVKDLVKEREDIDAKMSIADLARKKTDDHKIAASQEASYSERIQSVGQRIQELEQMLMSFSEEQ